MHENEYNHDITIYLVLFFLFFFNDTATTEIYTLSLHDALPISNALRTSGRCIVIVQTPSSSVTSIVSKAVAVVMLRSSEVWFAFFRKGNHAFGLVIGIEEIIKK